MIGRLLRDKGVAEFVDAARILKKSNLDINFSILGFLNKEDDSYIPYKLIKKWTKDGLIKYLGSSDDVLSKSLTLIV